MFSLCVKPVSHGELELLKAALYVCLFHFFIFFSKVGKMEMPKTVWLFKNTKALLLFAATQNKFSSVMLVHFCPSRITNEKKERNLACRFIYISYKCKWPTPPSFRHRPIRFLRGPHPDRNAAAAHINPFCFLTYTWKWFCHCCTHENKNRPNLWSHAMNTGE